MSENACCFIGHREIDENDELILRLKMITEKLIKETGTEIFYFGSKSQFNDVCYRTVTDLKQKLPMIKRVYIRAEYPYIDKEYLDYLLSRYEDTYYPEELFNSKKAVYIKRNFMMIDKSTVCVFYYDGKNIVKNRKSGTKIALDYALKKGKEIIVLP